jgi:hypothetical protein
VCVLYSNTFQCKWWFIVLHSLMITDQLLLNSQFVYHLHLDYRLVIVTTAAAAAAAAAFNIISTIFFF